MLLQEHQIKVNYIVSSKTDTLDDHIIKQYRTDLTQIYAEFNLRIQIINRMVTETDKSWQRFTKTKDSWMVNCTMGVDNQIVDFSRMKQFGLELQKG